MSCEKSPGRVAALAQRVGIPRLVGKKAFYVGLAVGAAGLALGGLVASRLRGRRRALPATLTDGRQTPALPGRASLMPATPGALEGKRCEGCNSSPGAKPGLWYIINEGAYCQDCAPGAARAAGLTLGRPSARAMFAGAALSAAPASAGGGDEDDSFSPGRRVKLSRVEGRVRVRVVTQEDSLGQPAPRPAGASQGGLTASPGWHFHDKAYLLLDGDGQDTGLAITPTVEPLRDSQGDLVKDERGRLMMRARNYGWYLTHVGSGTALAGPYKTLDQAQGLAEILAQLDWKRDELSSFSLAEKRHIWRALSGYEPGLGAYQLKYRQASIG